MPSFDVVSEVDWHEITNAIDQANRELQTRFDFRGVEAKFEKQEQSVRVTAEADIQLDQMIDILRAKMVKRSIDPKVMDIGDQEHVGKLLHKNVQIQEGLESLFAKRVVKLIKEKKLKVQAAIQGDKIRVTGKKRDDLQQVMATLKEEDFDVPLQYNNFRD
ncbi:MAG: YajQ family cyclic di-GMP-binding protein [Gammaproteobacteria bacterium]|jgi:uncharacterized protein YajQ (UPF0234 family)|nr:YajQ family cyclic di-GMP-binding protein [Gammaproteobacteria bacterium]HCC44616.1 YajQ family cyclic di-GMP-binding protein [Gammaproteobacteria bacterium]|tara:strand:- start:138 stop:620 length:483 start_codon:yes stop_codon:yes gene_type:complete